MLHRNSVLHFILRHLPWHRFDAMVTAHGSDKRVRTLPTRTQFIALVFAQLRGLGGLRETVTAFNSHTPRRCHLGARPVARSTLADANRLRPAALFEAMFATLVRQAQRGLRRELEHALYLIDSTSVRLSAASAGWARCSEQVCGAKVHVIFDAEAERRSMPRSARPTSTTSPPRRRCRSRLAPPMSSIWATMTMAGGRSCTRRAAGSSPG